MVSPSDENARAESVSSMLSATRVTVTAAAAVAAIEASVAVPFVGEVITLPEEFIAAVESDAPQFTVVAVRSSMRSSLTKSLNGVSSAGDVASLVADGVSLVVDGASPPVDEVPSEFAVIKAVPFPTAVISPAEETLATLESDVIHLTTASDMIIPAASFTVALRLAVSPCAENLSTVSDNSMLAGT